MSMTPTVERRPLLFLTDAKILIRCRDLEGKYLNINAGIRLCQEVLRFVEWSFSFVHGSFNVVRALLLFLNTSSFTLRSTASAWVHKGQHSNNLPFCMHGWRTTLFRVELMVVFWYNAERKLLKCKRYASGRIFKSCCSKRYFIK